MRVLVVESEPRAAESVADAMAAAGHEVVRCHDPGWRSFPCVGMDGTCPVEAGLDAAVLSRPRSSGEVSPLEDGVRCAMRAAVPIVHHGPGRAGPYADHVTASVPTDDVAGVVSAVEDAVAAPHERLSREATKTLHEHLAAAGHPTTGASARVHRSASGSRVIVDVDAAVPADAARRAAVWVVSRIRPRDGAGPVIDVVVNRER